MTKKVTIFDAILITTNNSAIIESLDLIQLKSTTVLLTKLIISNKSG